MSGIERRPRRMGMGLQRIAALGLLAALAIAPAALAQRTRLKPGWNIFSPQQDVEIGMQTSREAEQQLPMLNNRRVNNYLDRLGKRLASKAPGEKFPYQFKAVNDASINAFALPGGFLYVNRGLIEAAETEAQLAGVMGHEIAHAALRHGTNQATKAYIAQAPLAILGGVVGSNSVTGILAQIGAGFGANSLLLKYSRDAERQADLMGTQILYDSGYDPRAMAQFFEKLEAEGGSRPPEFFSSHPNPENRMTLVTEEIDRLGGYPANMKSDSREFREIKRYVASLPAPPAKAAPAGEATTSDAPAGRSRGRAGSARTDRPEEPSTRFQRFENDMLRLRHPDNWLVFEEEDSVTLTPEGGTVRQQGGGSALAYGMIISISELPSDRAGDMTLEDATDRLLESLRRSNPSMRVEQGYRRKRISGTTALATMLSNDSPVGGREKDWIVTLLRPGRLIYFVAVAPDDEYESYRETFEDILSSIRFH